MSKFELRADAMVFVSQYELDMQDLEMQIEIERLMDEQIFESLKSESLQPLDIEILNDIEADLYITDDYGSSFYPDVVETESKVAKPKKKCTYGTTCKFILTKKGCAFLHPMTDIPCKGCKVKKCGFKH